MVRQLSEENAVSGLLVSVIVPTYNRAHVIAEAITSILTQKPAPLEVIVVDDGSTDDTQDRLQPFENQIIRIHKANGGAASARNAGIKVAQGDWLAFLDSDDLWLPERMAVLTRDLSEQPLSVVAHLADVAFADGSKSLFQNENVHFPKGKAMRIETPFDAHIPGPLLQASALRASLVKKLGGFSEDLPIHEDTLLFRRLALKGDWLVTGDAVAQYRRIVGDDVALMDWETTRPIPFYQSRVQANTLLLRDEDLNGRRRDMVVRDQSGAYFQLAAAHSKRGERSLARKALMKSVRTLPRAKVIVRALASALFGNAAFDRILGQRTLSLHPDAQEPRVGNSHD